MAKTVLMIHGYGCAGSCWSWRGSGFEMAAVPVHVPGLRQQGWFSGANLRTTGAALVARRLTRQAPRLETGLRGTDGE